MKTAADLHAKAQVVKVKPHGFRGPNPLHEHLVKDRLSRVHRLCPTYLGASKNRRRRKVSDTPKEQEEGAFDVGRAFALSREGAAAFFAADIDGNKSLDFDEFIEIVPDAMKKDLNNAQLKELFDSVDTDGSGDISMDEFFLWTLSIVEQHTGTGLESVFRRYDLDGEGLLNAAEFALACEDLGFGAMAQDLFFELDHDDSGTISADELFGVLRSRGTSREAKRFLYGLASGASGTRVNLDTSKWVLTTESVIALRDQLVELLQLQTPAKVSDLYRVMTEGAGATLVQGESFGKSASGELGTLQLAMDRLGLPRGNQWFIAQLFLAIDADRSGQISERDFTDWMNNTADAFEKLRTCTLLKPLNREEDFWDSDSLRHALQHMLMCVGLAPVDLLRAWDRDQEGQLDNKEFVSNLKKGARRPAFEHAILPKCFANLSRVFVESRSGKWWTIVICGRISCETWRRRRLNSFPEETDAST